jgi:hypothetical protein
MGNIYSDCIDDRRSKLKRIKHSESTLFDEFSQVVEHESASSIILPSNDVKKIEKTVNGPIETPSLVAESCSFSSSSSSSSLKAELVNLAPSEFRSILHDAEKHCDLLFLKQHSDQQRTTEQQYQDYRCFAVVLHETHGMLLLHCTRKSKKKGPHYQVPGGRVHNSDFQRYYEGCSSSWAEHRYLAARESCATYLEEQTGLSIIPAKLWPMVVRKGSPADESNLMNEHKQRLFFVVKVSDGDFSKQVSEHQFRWWL